MARGVSAGRRRRGAAAGLALAIALAGLGLAPRAEACTCGYQDGLFTLVSIDLDGATGDWAPVEADPENVSCDPLSPVDRDFPVQSTGRDLVQFAITWDATHIYALTRRVGSSSNIQKFIYYADVDNDGRMEAGEPVIVARWRGSNRMVAVFFGFYQPADVVQGDLLTDGAGFGDGHDMPGTLGGLPPQGSPDDGGTWGSADGLAMEWRAPWSVLGVPAGSAIRWHVASTNSEPDAPSLPDQIDDNLGGCGGCGGSTQFAALRFAPDGQSTVSSGDTVHLPHRLTNDGNGTDTFDLSSTWSGDFAPADIRTYQDLGTLGSYDDGVDVLLTDTDGDGVVDSGPLAAGASLNLLVAVQAPVGFAGGTTQVVTTATASFVAACGAGIPVSASVTDLVELLGENAFAPDGQQTALPGTVVFFAHTFVAGSAGTVRFVTSHEPSPTLPGWEHALYQDLDCNATLDPGEPVLLPGASLASSPGDQVCLVVRESVPPGAAVGAQDLIRVTAEFTFAGSGELVSYTRTDLTTVGTPTTAGLVLQKHVDKTSAAPGETLVYTISYANRSSEPLSNIVIHDATPAFTTHVGGSAVCVGSLPNALTGCVATQPPGGGTGPVDWTLLGSLEPGQNGSVRYVVTIE